MQSNGLTYTTLTFAIKYDYDKGCLVKIYRKFYNTIHTNCRKNMWVILSTLRILVIYI